MRLIGAVRRHPGPSGGCALLSVARPENGGEGPAPPAPPATRSPLGPTSGPSGQAASCARPEVKSYAPCRLSQPTNENRRCFGRSGRRRVNGGWLLHGGLDTSLPTLIPVTDVVTVLCFAPSAPLVVNRETGMLTIRGCLHACFVFGNRA